MRRSSQGLLEALPPPIAAREPAPRRPVRRRSRLWRYRRVWFLVGLLGFTALAGTAWVLTQIPLPPETPQAQTTVIYDRTGAQLAVLRGPENRFPVKIGEVPPILVSAVVAVEDRKFFRHGGVDPLGIARATWADLRSKGVVQGGSTITQQYVKNAYVGRQNTLWRKIREAVISVKIERKLDKQQILERYLNTVYFGRGAYGVQAAARAYFGKDVAQLELRDAAYLAGLIRSPSRGDVADNPKEAQALRFTVLQALVDTSVVTPEQANEVEAVPLKDYVTAKPNAESEVTMTSVGAEYYVAYVRQELERRFSADQVLRGGMRVYTTLDPTAQRLAYDAVYGLLDRSADPAGALVSLDNDGRVVAMVGGKDWSASQVNLAVGAAGGGGGRQPGSTFKPFVLAEALSQGIGLESTFSGPARIVLPGADQGRDWEVSNYEGASYGRVSLLDATVSSINTVYAQLVVAVGPQKVVDMAHRLGIRSPLDPNASIALGTGDVSVLEMADAYLTLQTRGTQVEPRVISRVTQGDSVLVEDRPRTTRVLDQAVAEKVNYALQQVVDRGSGTGAAIPQAEVRGKTGTTDVYGDAWFVGYTGKLTTAVWMGYPEGQSKPLLNIHGVAKVNGGSLPAQIFKRYMSQASPPDDAAPPETVPDLAGKAVGSMASSGSSSSKMGAGSKAGRPTPSATTTTAPAPAPHPSPSTTVPEQAPAPPDSISVPAPAASIPPRTTVRRTTTSFTFPDRLRP